MAVYAVLVDRPVDIRHLSGVVLDRLAAVDDRRRGDEGKGSSEGIEVGRDRPWHRSVVLRESAVDDAEDFGRTAGHSGAGKHITKQGVVRTEQVGREVNRVSKTDPHGPIDGSHYWSL
jgi:hypothetical protein